MEWLQYPVLSLNFARGKFDTLEDLHSSLRDNFARIEAEFGRNREEIAFPERFSGAIRRAYELVGRPVVILIDEYDAPLQAALDKPELMEQYQSELRSIYLCLKNNEEYIRFAFLTGITAWGKMGVFSALNNLKDISMREEYATICGITDGELHGIFPAAVAQLAKKNAFTIDEAYYRLREQYDGYHFAKETPGVYNPYSLLNAFDSNSLENYWIETGRTRSITALVQHKSINVDELMGEVEATPDTLRDIGDMNESVVPFIYQAGYLTIKGYNPNRQTYLLQVPNTEVRESLGRHLIAPTFGFESDKAFRFRGDVREAIYYVNIQTLVDLINTHIFRQGHYLAMGEKEVYFQTNLATLFRVMGYEVDIEKATAKGRADLVVKTPNWLYIIETKLNGSAKQALNQINEKCYADAYATDYRPIVKLGLNFSETERIIDDYAVETDITTEY